jgi:hypothetical protein
VGELFDDVARTLATTPSRRRALGAIAGALTSAALVNLFPRSVLAASCPPGQVACGPTKQCLPLTGSSFTCCGYQNAPGTGSACAPGGCNTSTGVCCANTTHGQPCGGTCTSPGGQCCDPRNNVVCGPGQSCCHPASGTAPAICCPANMQCQNGQCVPRGSNPGQSGGGGQPPTSCPPGATLCGSFGQCCAPPGQCINGQCVFGQPGGGGNGQPPQSCPPGAALCGSNGQCCPTSGMGQCCGTGATAACCWGGTCINGVCVRGQPPTR